MSGRGVSFAALGVSAALVRALEQSACTEPTAIQTLALPPMLAGRDVWACAPTGSGKTAAYALPLLQATQREPGGRPAGRLRRTQGLVVVPTRELAAQVGGVLRESARHLSLPPKVAVVFGGVSINPQMMALRGGAELVVATPGRLLDLIHHNALHLGAIDTLVLDEADRLLETGFADELARLLAELPARRQTVLFSATFAPSVQALAQGLLHDPVRLEVPPEGPQTSAPLIDQRAIEVDAPRRTPLLRHLIQEAGWSRVLVFVASSYASEHVADKLRRQGVDAVALHGRLSQGARTQVLAAFKSSHVRVVVATDLAARGLDIAALPVVVNFDLPRSATDHLHRIGRTGRAGAPGLAVSFISAESEAHFRLIEKRQGERLPREQVPGFEPLTRVTAEAAVGGVKGKRKSKKDKLREARASSAKATN